MKINIINFYKDHSLYEKGLKPVVYSEKHFENTKEGWTRFCNDNISYYRSDYKKLNPFPPNIKNNPEKRLQLEQQQLELQKKKSAKNKNVIQQYYFTLTFTYKFLYDNDHVYFSHCFPYTYSDLVSYISKLKRIERSNDQYQVSVLGRTPIGTAHTSGRAAPSALRRSRPVSLRCGTSRKAIRARAGFRPPSHPLRVSPGKSKVWLPGASAARAARR